MLGDGGAGLPHPERDGSGLVVGRFLIPAALGTDPVVCNPDMDTVLNTALVLQSLTDLGSCLAAAGVPGPWLATKPTDGEGKRSSPGASGPTEWSQVVRKLEGMSRRLPMTLSRSCLRQDLVALASPEGQEATTALV